MAGAANRAMLAAIPAVEAAEPWLCDGARDLPHWLSMRYGISYWRARRVVVAAHALESLPQLAAALRSGQLSLDKTLELARFATPQTESRLIEWALDVSPSAVRRRADRAQRPEPSEVSAAEEERSVH